MIILSSKEEFKLYVFYFFIVGILYLLSFIRFIKEKYKFGFIDFTYKEGFGINAHIMTTLFLFYLCCRLGMNVFCWWFDIPIPPLAFSHK